MSSFSRNVFLSIFLFVLINVKDIDGVSLVKRQIDQTTPQISCPADSNPGGILADDCTTALGLFKSSEDGLNVQFQTTGEQQDTNTCRVSIKNTQQGDNVPGSIPKSTVTDAISNGLTQCKNSTTAYVSGQVQINLIKL